MTDSSNNSVEPAPRRKGANWIRTIFIVLLVAAGGLAIAWNAGAMRPKPKVAIITSNEDVYWDPLFDGAQTAARAISMPMS